LGEGVIDWQGTMQLIEFIVGRLH